MTSVVTGFSVLTGDLLPVVACTLARGSAKVQPPYRSETGLSASPGLRSSGAPPDGARSSTEGFGKRPMTAKTQQDQPFWRTKTLDEMSHAEWESLCDGCGRCCLVKLEDEDTGDIHFTDIGCKLLHTESCRCADYSRRRRRVPDCVKLTPEGARTLSWLPSTCAYRVLAEGRDLAWWHPLLSG